MTRHEAGALCTISACSTAISLLFNEAFANHARYTVSAAFSATLVARHVHSASLREVGSETESPKSLSGRQAATSGQDLKS